MNEQDIERKLVSYRDQLGACTKVPVARRTRWPVAAIGALAVIFVAIATLWPRDAAAAALARVSAAIKNARTMEATQAQLRPDGKTWHEFQHLYYEDGKWRMTTWQGSAIETLYIVAGDRVFTDRKRLDHATVEPLDPEFHSMLTGNDMDAIDFAKQQIDVGEVSTEREVTVAPGAEVDGKPTYRIMLQRPNDHYKAEIIVDEESDLPISSKVDMSDDRNGASHFRQTYAFNQELPHWTFDPPKDKPVVDLIAVQNKLATRWKTPIASFEDARILDGCVTDDGVIWIAVSVPDGSGWATLPRRIQGGNPSGYVDVIDLNPSAILGKTRRFELGDRQVVVVPFMPLADGAVASGFVAIGFDRAHGRWAGTFETEVKSAPQEGSVSLSLRRVAGDRPEYFTALDLDHFGFQLPIVKFRARAKGLEKLGYWLDAALAHERAALAYAGFVKYAGYISYGDAARCYRKVGLEDEAKRCEEESRALRLGHER